MYSVQHDPHFLQPIDPVVTTRERNGHEIRVESLTRKCHLLYCDGRYVGQFPSHTAIQRWIDVQETM